MGIGNALERRVEECWVRLGISSLDAWDVLVFLARHRTSLATTDQMARLLGQSGTELEDALDRLEALRLIRRSGAAGGVRLCELIDGGEDLRHLGEHRCARLLVRKRLPKGEAE